MFKPTQYTIICELHTGIALTSSKKSTTCMKIDWLGTGVGSLGGTASSVATTVSSCPVAAELRVTWTLPGREAFSALLPPFPDHHQYQIINTHCQFHSLFINIQESMLHNYDLRYFSALICLILTAYIWYLFQILLVAKTITVDRRLCVCLCVYVGGEGVYKR